MAILNEREVRDAALIYRVGKSKTADAILREGINTWETSFDVFLSHSRLDSELILGVKAILEQLKLKVYVDWIDDPQLDRSSVTPATAQQLRKRMQQCKSLFYAHSTAATKSRWMPWELGYFDAFNGNVAIVPIAAASGTIFKGEEFLGLYPYVDVTGRTPGQAGTLYIHRDLTTYKQFRDWRDGAEKLRPVA
ncbi:TIR domain-containing protein [Mesorhizobium sp. LjRoot246]|uniref:TIR domain-containing protein n=1 Tax=Mesorhizobium sp. LjRoot246 TaxID=3342294 RepID=UPI003ED101B7